MREDGTRESHGFAASPWRRGPGAAAWHNLSTATRRACLSLLRERAVVSSAVVKDVTPEVRAELEREGFIFKSSGPASAGLSTDEIPDAALELLGWLAVLESAALLSPLPLLDLNLRVLFGRDAEGAEDLAAQVITRGGFRPLVTVSPTKFLETTSQTGRWLEWAAPTNLRTPAEARLIAILMAAGGTMTTSDLEAAFPDTLALDEARETLCRRLVLFHDLRRESLDVEIGFLASVRLGFERGHRCSPTPLATPRDCFQAALLHDDAVATLREEEPRLEPLPYWVERALGLTDVMREVAARGFVESQGLLQGSHALPQARAFLALPRDQRLRRVLAAVMPKSQEEVFDCFGVVASAVVVAWARQPKTPSPRDAQKLREHVARAFGKLESGRFVFLAPFVADACEGSRAPLLLGAEPYRVNAMLHDRAIAAGSEAIELASRVLLREVIQRLVILGGAAIALVDGDVAFAINDAGRFLLGLTDTIERMPCDLEPTAQVDEDGVVLLANDSAATISELGLFAGTSRDMSGRARAFRITRPSLHAAIAAGMTENRIRAVLERVAQGTVPPKLLESIHRWCESVRPVVLARELVIECPDERTLALVRVELGGSAAELHHALRVALPTRASAADVACRLSALGIVAYERAAKDPGGTE